jgi:hypothetical protein
VDQIRVSKPETIDQVVLKLVGWRTQTYPLKITVDDKIVYHRNDIALARIRDDQFAPVTGKSIKIELTGEATNRDRLGNIIEITGAAIQTRRQSRRGDKARHRRSGVLMRAVPPDER